MDLIPRHSDTQGLKNATIPYDHASAVTLRKLLSAAVSTLPKPLHRVVLRVAYVAYVVRERLFNAPLGCAVITRNAAGEVLLVQHSYRHRGIWTLPSGVMGEDELPIDAASRELREELRCELTRASVLEYDYWDDGRDRWRTIVVAGETNATPTPDLREVDAAEFFPLYALPAALEGESRRRLERLQLRATLPIEVPPFVKLEYAAAQYGVNQLNS